MVAPRKRRHAKNMTQKKKKREREKEVAMSEKNLIIQG